MKFKASPEEMSLFLLVILVLEVGVIFYSSFFLLQPVIEDESNVQGRAHLTKGGQSFHESGFSVSKA